MKADLFRTQDTFHRRWSGSPPDAAPTAESLFDLLPGRVRLPVAVRATLNLEVDARNDRFPLSFALLWLFIGWVSAFDTYLLVRFQESIADHELNPVGCWLLQIDGGSVALFVGCKVAGTMLVLGITSLLYFYRRTVGMVVTWALFLFQSALLAFLVWP